MDIATGQIVYSKRGRDSGLPFVVVAVQDGFAFLADGKLRKIAKPKKKKRIHLQPTNTFAEEIREKLERNQPVNDSSVRKALIGLLSEE